MKILKRSVESSQFKHKLNRFYRVKVKPILLSFKHFFKSSHKFFIQHPRLRMCSIVGGVFLTLIVISAVANTFSKNVLTNNIDYARFDKYVDEFWHNLSRNVSVSNDEDGNETYYYSKDGGDATQVDSLDDQTALEEKYYDASILNFDVIAE